MTARGPAQSDATVRSIESDTSLHGMIWKAVRDLEWNRPNLNRTFDTGAGCTWITDDDVWEYLERATGRRFQRNVIARARIRMEKDGHIERRPDVVGRTGRKAISYVAVVPQPEQQRMAV